MEKLMAASKLKSFAELKHMTPDQHPASKHKKGTKLMDHMSMMEEGDTGFSARDGKKRY
jgi:hypothetical protein